MALKKIWQQINHLVCSNCANFTVLRSEVFPDNKYTIATQNSRSVSY